MNQLIFGGQEETEARALIFHTFDLKRISQFLASRYFARVVLVAAISTD